jgi:hypothetical protein
VPPVLLVAADEVSNKRRSSLQCKMSAFGTKRTSKGLTLRLRTGGQITTDSDLTDAILRVG